MDDTTSRAAGGTRGDDGHDYIVCATYTHARRHPLVLGAIAGWTLPFQVSVSQLAVVAFLLWVELQTWPWWGGLLPRHYSIVIAIAVPSMFAWVLRRVRIEGRSLPRCALGLLAYLTKPPNGRIGGRSARPRPINPSSSAWVFVAKGDEG